MADISKLEEQANFLMKNNIRDRLIDLINQDNCPSPYICDEKCKYSHLEQCIGDRLADHLIENDVIPVVRCKDCKYWNNGDCYRIELTRPDDYCSYGEQKL